jgi:hypothetical protein
MTMSDVFGSLSADSLPSGYGEDDSSNALMPTLTQGRAPLNIPGAWSSSVNPTVPIKQGVPDGLDFDMYEEKAKEPPRQNPETPAPQPRPSLTLDEERGLFFRALQNTSAKPNPGVTVSAALKRDPNATQFTDSGGYIWDINSDGSVTSLNKETVNKRFPPGSNVAQAVLGQAKVKNVPLPKLQVGGPTTTALPSAKPVTAAQSGKKLSKVKGKAPGKKNKKRKGAGSKGKSTAVEVVEALAPVAAAAVGVELPDTSADLEDTSLETYEEEYEEEEDEGMGTGAKIALALGLVALAGAGYYFYTKQKAANAAE